MFRWLFKKFKQPKTIVKKQTTDRVGESQQAAMTTATQDNDTTDKQSSDTPDSTIPNINQIYQPQPNQSIRAPTDTAVQPIHHRKKSIDSQQPSDSHALPQPQLTLQPRKTEYHTKSSDKEESDSEQ